MRIKNERLKINATAHPMSKMLPIMISEMAPATTIATVLFIKFICGMIFGFLINFILEKSGRLHTGLASKHTHDGHGDYDIDQLCDEANCKCDDHCEHESGKHAWGHIALCALKHSLQVIVFVLVISLCLNLLIETGAIENLFASDASYGPYLTTFITAILGLIPNCGISVGITELYLEGYLCGGALISGLLVNAGCGLLVLIRTNKDWRENLRIALLLVTIGLVCGCLIQAIGIL
ncbi:MAG: arsenic efflux protein [Coriobacteriales bacterium]|nr:arsenic efflux protein [Coriobacteriales bacterium]